jgi:fructose-bisphosphate aldolase, class I
MPIVAHIYPRDYSDGVKIVFTPEEIAWAVRCGIETGVDVIKVGYVGDPVAFKEIVDNCPVPIVIAGGPKEPTLLDALTSTQAAIQAGAKGAVVGRNVWGADDPKKAAKAYYGVINANLSPAEALSKAGL